MGQFIELNHGAGGKQFDNFFKKELLPHLENPILNQATDGALLGEIKGRLVMATDSHVVSPRIFPGGTLGKLAFCGTVNDLAMMGAKPLYLSLGMIVEEGFPLEELKVHLEQIGSLAKNFSIPIVTGDTKVVESGKADGLFFSTTGVGVIKDQKIDLHPKNITVGSKVIINGPIGEHGISVLSQRENLGFETEVLSDCAPLHEITLKLLEKFPQIQCMRDPTRGGVAAALNELAEQADVEISLDEKNIQVPTQVLSACELLGLDPLILANEGKFLLFAPEQIAEEIVVYMNNSLSQNARIIGMVNSKGGPLVRSTTNIGGGRMIPWPTGDQLPRIC